MRGTDQFSYTHVLEIFMRHKKKSDFMLGLDEAGRGPWAGPMTASVVILRTDTVLKTVKDSKKMNLESREDAIDEIWNKAAYYKTGHVTSEEIDTKGIANAWHDLTSGLLRDAYKMFPDVPGVVDGSVRVRGFNDVVALPKADNIILAASAASVLAKYRQTCYMESYDEKYPEYGFREHHGYGTADHLKALERYGVCPIHRMSFQPIKRIISRSAG